MAERWKSRESNNVNDADHYPTKNCQQSSNGGWQSNALVSSTKTPNPDQAPVGDDIEQSETPHDDVEMGNDEDKEPLEWGN